MEITYVKNGSLVRVPARRAAVVHPIIELELEYDTEEPPAAPKKAKPKTSKKKPSRRRKP
jgi:hypothetical protein